MNVYIPVRAKAHTPPYKIHRYFARRPWNVFKQLIELYSKRGDIVLDPFCGGGVTVYEGLKLGRKVIGLDINPLSIFIVENMIRQVHHFHELDSASQRIEQYLEILYSDYERTEFVSKELILGKALVPVEWNELAWVITCNYCGDKIVLSNDNKLSNGRYVCKNPSCPGSSVNGGHVEPIDCERIGYEYLYSVITSPVDKTRVNVAFTRKRRNSVSEHIKYLRDLLRKNDLEIPSDEIPLNWDRQHEDLLLRKGIKTLQDLFTERNLIINLLLLNFIKNLEVRRETYEILRLAFSSSLRDTNIMSFTSKGWQSGRPTTWSKHAYWIPSQFCEVNVNSAFQRALNRVMSALEFNNRFDYQPVLTRDFNEMRRNCNVLLDDVSVDRTNIPDNSIDVIITDPPYGSNVQYLELSHFWYPWNKDMYSERKPDFSTEAVANRRDFQGAKTLKDYETNLYAVFDRCYDVLKPAKYMVLTFNNRDVGAWLALLISIFKAEFSLAENGLYYQSGIKNYKQTAHTKYKGSPYGDFIYVFWKDPKHVAKETIESEDEFMKKLDRVFARHLAKFREASYGKNEAIKRMILEAMPKIEGFARSKSVNQTGHNIYEKYINYFTKLYSYA